MKRQPFLTVVVLLCAGALTAASQANAGPVKRILIVGDSWAACIATQAVGMPGFGSFDAVLTANRMGGYSTEGAVTAWGGREADDWAQPQNLAKITQQLQAYPTIDIVHLIIGGNDFLNLVAHGVSVTSYTPEQRSAFWDGIEADIQAIVDHCLALRPDIKVLISDYDYLDAAKATTAYGMNFGGATPRQLNDAFVELGQRKLAIAQRTPRCAYVSNWGVLQHFYGYPIAGLPEPGTAPDYDPYTAGDLDAAMPPTASVGDGIHPTDAAHRYMLQRCIDQFYFTWLTASGAQPDTDGDGILDGDELRDLDPATAGIQNPFDPTITDSTGNNGLNSPDGVPDGQNDYDSDGMSNAEEIARGFNPLDPSDPALPVSASCLLTLGAVLLAVGAVRVIKNPA